MAPLMTGGIVTSLEILDTKQVMGYRGSKSDRFISVKEQRVDGSSVLKKKYCKVYSKCQGNLVFIQAIKYVNTIFESIQRFYAIISNYLLIYIKEISFLFNYVTTNKINPQ